MEADYDRSGLKIFHGDCREVLSRLDAGSINCCVTSPPLDHRRRTDAVEPLRFPIQRFAHFNVFVRKSLVCDSANCAVAIWKVAVSDDFCSVLRTIRLKLSQGEGVVGLRNLDFQERKKRANDRLGLFVGHGPAEKRPALRGVFALSVVRSAKRIGQKFYGRFLNHADLNSSMVAGRCAALASVGFLLFDSDAAFAVNEARTVGNVCF